MTSNIASKHILDPSGSVEGSDPDRRPAAGAQPPQTARAAARFGLLKPVARPFLMSP
ncbi:hypothetical protein [Streptomyces sp. NBC_01589]|uniref:hypothetical protein n=1 Tax=unclassified Streptomyces TaxID=2593676 RepID=UPI00386D7B3D